MITRFTSSSRNLFLFLFFFHPLCLWAQAPKKLNAAEILLALKKLNVVGNALYVAAHPDDENTALIAWLANEQLVNTGYLSLTRGDGGQNLIGSEIRERLGLIRTHELLQARRLDGGQQFFTRAVDFGFSKDYQETLTIWDKEKVLSDMVWTIRKFKPDVMITRFSPAPGGTHGHHTTSAILAAEAFDAAADPKRFPEQLNQVTVWQPKRLLWNTSSFFYGPDRKFDPTGKIAVEVSTYNPLLGKSYTEIAAASRTMHKSQGFGSGSNYSKVTDYLEHTKGARAEKNLFEGVDLSWNRVAGGKKIGDAISRSIQVYNPANPVGSIPALLEIKKALDNLPDNPYKNQKLQELQEIIKSCAGIFIEATADQNTVTPGGNVAVTALVVNRSAIPVTLKSLTLNPVNQTVEVSKNITAEVTATKIAVSVPRSAAYSQPYWLKQESTLGMFAVPNQDMIGRPENLPALEVQYSLTINTVPFTFKTPVVYKRVDPVDGEVYKPFSLTPPVYVALQEQVYVFADDTPKNIQVKVKAGKENSTGTVALQVPANWRIEPATMPFNLKLKNEEQLVTFKVFPVKTQTEGIIKAVATMDGQTYDKSLVTLAHNHIPEQLLFPEAQAKVTRLDLKKKGNLIGYIMGPGDEVPASLEQVGYKVNFLSEGNLNQETLKQYDAVVVGVRAYNTNTYLKFAQPALLEYVKNGGTMLVQFNVNNGLVTEELGPYPFKISRDRITVEAAPIKFLQPEHPVLNTPNKISLTDFDNWVQERGLYFPNSWDAQYQTIISAQDPGEPEQAGGLLVAKYGKGYYIYTGYAFFRQLPAGVPGAYRLFTNLISIGKK